MFIDLAEVYLKAGDGGNGIVSFHREKFIANGGPDGGDGGDGGNIIFVVDMGLRTLVDFRYRRKYNAPDGDKGGTKNSSGRKGESLVVRLPLGTLIKDKGTGEIIADLSKDGQEEIIVRGGRGGWGNQHFATPTRQVPNFARNGTPGQERTVILELKLLADVGLIGFPNVGKSTLLSVVSAARPKIANYPFTTITPNLGVVSVAEGASFVMADIPGLIEGAHEGVGLGHNFLKHIERTRLLIHVVDISETDGRDAIRDFEIINQELDQYNPEIAKRPQIVAANKADALDDPARLERFKKEIEGRGYLVFVISAATNQGVPELIRAAYEKLRELPGIVLFDTTYRERVIRIEKEEPPYTVTRDNEAFVVDGPWVRKILGSVNIEDRESLQYFQRVMKSMGVIESLKEKGVRDGDTVRIGEIEFDYIP